MGWSAQDIEKLRKQNKGQTGATGSTGNSAVNSSAHSDPSSVASGDSFPRGGSQSGGWSAEKIDALRANSGVKAAAKSGTDAWVNRGAGTSVRSAGNSKNSAGNSSEHSGQQGGSLGAEVLKQMNGVTGTPAKTGSSKLQLAVPEKSGQAYLGRNGIETGKTVQRGGNAQPEWLTKPQPGKPAAQKATAPAATVRGTVQPTADQRAQARRNGSEGVYAMGAQAVSDYTEEMKATDKFSDFDRLNRWMDSDPTNRELVALLRMGKGNKPYAERSNAMQPGSASGAAASAAAPEKATEKQEYTDAELMAKGYSKQQISEARQYITDFDALPDWQRAARRTSNTIGGIGYTVASAPFLVGETGVQAVKNETATSKNWTELQQSVQGDARQRELLRMMTGGKTQYAGRDNAMQVGSSGAMAAPESTGSAYTDEELKAKGYTQSEIDRMRARISGAKVSEGIDPEKSFGYQLYHRGQQLNEAAQAGMSPIGKQLMGVATSAAENLAVAGISPALVLPVLSAQGGAEAMGQSIEKGESAGKTLAGGLAKFGAGWAINSVGAADLAKTMGSDYAKDTLAGKLADVVRSVADNGTLAQQYPTIANTISGGVDNAMQAFVETYADMAIDAALGDAEAAQNLFTRDTFLQAVESGLTGGASGALGGAVGTQLGKMSAAMETPQSAAQTAPLSGEPMQRQAAANDRQAGNAAQPAEDAAVLQQETAPAANEAAAEQTAVKSSNPAVQQLAEAMDSGKLTSRTIKLFTPNAANEANRAAFAEEYGVELPGTAAQTRQMLRQMEAERSTAKAQAGQDSQEPGQNGQKLGQNAVQPEQTGELKGTGREIRDGVMTTWNPDGTVETQVLDPEMAARAQAERQAAAQQQTVENAGETVESQTVQQTEPATLRETAGLEVRSEGAQKSSVQKELQRWKVSEGAAKTLSRNMPEGIADESRYAAAASSLYRLGQMEDVTTFDKAMELAKGMNGLAVNTEYVLAQPGGEAALKVAWLQGKGEAEAGALQAGTPGGVLSEKSTSGSGRVLYKGTMRTADEVATKLIELNARATDTDAVLKAVLEGDERVRAYVDTAAGQIFFADSAGDVFGTVLHEDWHWYNALDAEGAKALQQHVLEYLAKSEGFENIDELIRAKLSDYAQQNLTYGEAAEELVADAWRGIFDSEESFKRWVEFQRGQAEKNAGRAGTIRKVMNAVKDLLNGIVSRAKEVLAKDPENRAALKAQRLAEAEKRALQEEYFAHAEKAMENLRAAKENAATLENKGAAKERRYEINPEYADDVDQWDKDGRNRNEVFVLGSTGDALQGLGAIENDIFMRGSKINLILKEHPEMTLEEIKRIPEILDDPVMILTSQNKGRTKQNTRLVMFGDVKAQDGRPVLCVLDLQPSERSFVINDMQKVTSAYTKDNNPIGFVRDSTVLYTSENKKRTIALLQSLGFQLPIGLQHYGSMGTIAYEKSGVKFNGVKFTELEGKETVKKNIRFQLAAPVEVDSQKDLVAVHNLTEQNLQEALELGGMPSPSIAVVKAQEGHSMYGPISLVFGSETIDPMANSANRIYGSDAWTPTRPGVEYKVDSKAGYAFEDAVYEASKDAFEGKFANSAVLRSEEVNETSTKNREEIAQKLQSETAVQLAYLKEKGKTVEPVYRAENAERDSFGNDVLEKLVELAGADEIRNAMEGGDWDAMEALADKAADALTETRTHGKLEGMNQRWEKRIANLRENRRDRLIAMVNNAYKMLTDTSGGKAVLDVEATRQKIREAAPANEVKEWAEKKLEGVLGEKGIRNGKEKYTPSGKQRSFAQLHYAYTLENLVKAMNQQQEARGQGAWGLSAKTLMSTATAEYGTLDEVRADKGRLQQMPEEEYNKLLEEADSEISEVVKRIRSETAAHAASSFEEQEILGGILMQAAQGKRTAAAIGKVFAKEGYIIGKDTAQQILKLYNDVAKIPTGYFEAKPQRAVGFDEVRAAILPDNASKSLIEELRQKGVKVELYKAGDDAERTAVLNRVPDVRFQIAEQAERDAKRNEQQQASRVIAEKAAALDTLSQFFGLTKGVNVSRSAVDELAGRWLKANGSKADRAKLAQETEVLVNYLKADGADMNKAEALAETLAGEIQDGATYRNTELWNEYPELHKLEYTVNKAGQAKDELVKRYGSWSEAVAEARRHGVTLRQADGVRDGNPAEQYESIINDTRATGGITDGARALWKQAAEKAGVAGALSMESTEWLDVLMNLHDEIKPKTMSRFADDAEYEDAKVELAGRIIGDIMQLPQLTDAQAIFEGIQRHNMEVAKAAAGDESRAAEVEKGLKGVQKAQSREFDRRLAENQRMAGRNTEVQQMRKLQRQNAKAEKLLNENLETLGVDVNNVGDLNEKLTVLRESYEREMKAEVKRMKTERQQMLDEAKLWYRERMGELREENADLARQVKAEQRRADKAEYSLLVQENEIMEWEEENQRKAAAWQEKQAQRNALAIETARQQRDEEIAIAKRVAEQRVQRARDGRKMDELKRGIRQDAAALNQMVLRPSKGKYVSQRLIVQAAEVAKIADMTILNDRAVAQLTRLQNSIQASMGSEGSPTAMTTEWEQTKVPELITALQNDLTAWKDAKLADLQAKLAEAEALPESEKALALQERLKKRIRETENRTYLPMTVDQMRMLKAITSATLHVIRNENKTVSLAKAEEVSRIADEAAYEVKRSKGNHPGGALDGLQNLLTKYNLDMLGAERVLRMLGGYKNGGQMEKIGQMLNDGQYRQTKITIEGEKLFADVTGKEHARQAKAFAGPGADLVDVGLTDTDHNAVPLTHAQMCSLYMHLQNKDSREHLMTGGMVVPDAQLYSKGDIEQAYQKGKLVQLGMLSDGHGEAMADTILNTLEAAMTDYDRAWCADMKEFFGNYTTKLINETSLQLVGYKRATVKNYYPIAVDKTALATEIDGVKMDATIEGRGFLKNRVKSSKPILLEECSSVVQRSLRDTAAYAGLAAPIRDVQKILNAGVETRDGVKTLKNGIIKEHWGTKAVSYLDDLLTDLQTTQRHRSNGVSRALSTLRGNYAGAVLTLNPGVAIAQAASLPTAAAVLGGDTMASVVPFVKNLSPKQKAALEAEIAEHGDVLLQWRQRGSGEGELQSIGKRETLVQKGMDKVPGWLTGWINGMDEITVAALWEGSKAYVKNHAAEFEGAGETGSPAYWEAVNRTYQKVIEQTQPNYTVMQRAGIQRNPDEMVKTFTMFTTQRFQNAGILIDAVGDWKAQAARYKADASDANKAELKRATQQRNRAIVSQAAQVAVFAMMKIGADFLLHRWDREQDENGDVTLKSLLNRFFSLSTESVMGNFLGGSELYSLIDNAVQGKDYDVISATNISAVNDMASDLVKFTAELKKDTSEMDEEELEKHHQKLLQKGLALIENGFEIAGVPYGNGRKMVDAVRAYAEDIQNVAQGGKFSFNSLPESATGQYDRLYNAYASGDADEAQAAVEKLVAMGKEDEIYKQLKTRLVKYDKKVEAAAKARNAGDDETRVRLTQEIISDVYDVMGIRKNVKEDAERRTKVIDMVTGDNRDGKGSEGAINVKADALLKGDSGDMYTDLSDAVDSRKAQDVQAEYDRLVRAGKDAGNIKKEITKLAKPDYLAGSDADKQKMADMLLALTDADGNALYTEKNFSQWETAAENAAEKEAAKEPEADPYEKLR